MSRIKKDQNLISAIELLSDAFNRVEGQYSNIPECCIEVYVAGRTFAEYKESLSEKEQKKLHQWGYVPCDDCFKKNRKNEILKNGTSDLGEMILAIQNLLIRRIEK